MDQLRILDIFLVYVAVVVSGAEEGTRLFLLVPGRFPE